jgi:hypothetical protein
MSSLSQTTTKTIALAVALQTTTTTTIVLAVARATTTTNNEVDSPCRRVVKLVKASAVVAQRKRVSFQPFCYFMNLLRF